MYYYNTIILKKIIDDEHCLFIYCDECPIYIKNKTFCDISLHNRDFTEAVDKARKMLIDIEIDSALDQH